jgi:F-type H+-transporting ATPase subunit delta
MELLDARKIASRYAKALIEAADEQGQLDAVTQDIERLQRVYLEVPELNRFFANPAIPVADKQDVVKKQFHKGLSSMMGNLFSLLVENDRIAILPEILQAAVEIIRKRDGIAQAEVTVPIALSDALEKKMRKTLEKLFGYQQVELNIKVDPAILAGAVVKIGDKIIDGSYHGKLETLRRQVG